MKKKKAAAPKKTRAKKAPKPPKPSDILTEALSLHKEVAGIRDELEGGAREREALLERIQDIEIHVNLLTRLLTTLCVEKFGMRVGVLKRMIKRIEKEAIRDSQILHLESLYNLSGRPSRKEKEDPPSSPDDPWDDIA